MITQETFVEIHVLHKQGLGIRAIARKLGLSKNTVRRYLRQPIVMPSYSPRAKRPTKLEPFTAYLLQRIDAAKPHWIPAAVLFREIKALGYGGGITLVRAYVSQQKPKSTEAVTRFETAPGVQLQVDFTTIRRGRHALKAFVATLGFSRASFVRFTESERQEDWLEGISLALSYFGGVPREILFDNAKCIMIQRDAYGDGQHKWNTLLLDQAKHYGYKPKACQPYRAKTKGKVERFNRYLKESFITPLAASLRQAGLELTADLANAHIGPWLAEVAHQRDHGTTKVKPAVRLEEERQSFMPLPATSSSALPIQPKGPALSVMPFESLQHSLTIYDQLLEAHA
jgi:transposase